MLYGAIIGDVAGSIYEFNNIKTRPAVLFSYGVDFTDDTVMTLAVADAIMNSSGKPTESEVADAMRKWANLYPYRGYGGRFAKWLESADPKPYYSCGNGSAMRVSPVGWWYDNIDDVREVARITALPTHNHPEGIKGAEAVASAIFLARRDRGNKLLIRDYITEHFGYDLTRTCDEIRPTYTFDETCPKTVPEAITAFLESENYFDCIQLAISLGGDSDTVAAIAGSIAGAFYGVPNTLKAECDTLLTPHIRNFINQFNKRVKIC